MSLSSEASGRHWPTMKVMKSPFSSAVQARPMTLSQLRPNHFSVSAGSLYRSGFAEVEADDETFTWKPASCHSILDASR